MTDWCVPPAGIRQLQCILLKVALLLGVEVYENVGYEELVEPSDERSGWRARLSPPDHPAADFQFDVPVGADGKRNTFKCECRAARRASAPSGWSIAGSGSDGGLFVCFTDSVCSERLV